MADIYTHPNVSATIVSEEITVVTGQGETVLFSAFTAPRGEDRVVKEFSSPSSFMKEYGDDFTILKNRQQPFNAVNWAVNGLVKAMRVTLPDATYANLIYTLMIKVDGTEIDIKPVVRSEQNMYTLTQLKNALDNGGTPDIDGYRSFDLFALHVPGRGSYGNAYKVTLDAITAYQATFAFPMLSFQMAELDSGYYIGERDYAVALDPDARSSSKNALFVEDLVNKYEAEIVVLAQENIVEEIEDFLSDADFDMSKFNPTPVFDQAAFDQKMVTLAALPEYTITESDYDDAIATSYKFDNWNDVPFHNDTYTTVCGVDSRVDSLFHSANHFQNGSDGNMGIVEVNGEDTTYDDRVDTELAKAYSGEYDVAVVDTARNYIDVLLDGNEPKGVKASMIDLAVNTRGDCHFFADVGFTGTAAGAIQAASDLSLNVNSMNVSIWGQDALVDDPFGSNREIRVTVPYFLASKVPANDTDISIGKNFVGTRRGLLNNVAAEKWAWFPTVPNKESLFQKRINYVVNDTDTYLDTQLTTVESDRAETRVSVARAIVRMVRIAKRIGRATKHEYFSSNTYSNLSTSMDNALASFISDGTCENINVTVGATEYEKLNRLVNVGISIKMTDIIERVAINFTIQR